DRPQIHPFPTRRSSDLHSWELTQTQDGHWICINTARANQIVAEALKNNHIPELSGYASLRTEVKYGTENSRVDIVLDDPLLPSRSEEHTSELQSRENLV